jgi:hypothetical protein
MGFELVLIDGKFGAIAPNFSLGTELAPHIAFRIPSATEPVPASIDVRLGRWRQLAGFRLKIAGRVVYAEGEFAHLPPEHDLPIPASEPQASPESLPLPGGPPE